MKAAAPTNYLYRGDCKYIMQGLLEKDTRVDLIYLDPPFNSSRIYNMIFNGGGISAQQKAFHDMWNFTERAHQLSLEFMETIDQLNDIPQPFKDFIKAWVRILASGSASDKKLLNYLMYMTDRLLLMKRLLKNSGSIYFHCDAHASHYIKIIMDGIFDKDSFRNEIIWKSTNSPKAQTKGFGSQKNSILLYSKNSNPVFNKVYRAHDEKSLKPYRYDDNDGRGKYRVVEIEAHGIQKSENRKRFKFLGRTAPYLYKLETLQKWHKEGIIYASKNGRLSKKQYLHEMEGVLVSDIWVDSEVPPIQSSEKRGYDTQKPITLLKRIIQASSNEGDLVLDPFCGCGTTVAASIELNRNWIGIDISGDAVNEIEARIKEMKKVHMSDGCKYKVIESSPETMKEYKRLNAFEKQDWLIRKVGGFPNPKKTGDGGVDGELTIHLGGDKWGKMIFSVKTGKQSSPELIRELRGTMQQEKAVMGGLILDVDPSQEMERKAETAGLLKYELETLKGTAEQTYNKVQILTSQEIIDGKYFLHPPTLSQKKNADKHRGDLL